MLIEKMMPEHIESVLEIEKASFKTPWTQNMFLTDISQDYSIYRVVTHEGRALAYMGMLGICKEGHITNIAVSPSFRRRGLATMLINHFIDYAKKNDYEFLTLEVRVSNLGAVSLYKQLGFVQVGIRKKYYENSEDALLLTLYFK